MMRSTRASTLTSTRASRSAQKQRQPSDSGARAATGNRQGTNKSSPRSAAEKKNRHHTKDRQNGRSQDSDEDTSGDEEDTPSKATRSTPNRKRSHETETHGTKKAKLSKGARNGATENGVDDINSSEEDLPHSERTKSRASNGKTSDAKKTSTKSPTQVAKKAPADAPVQGKRSKKRVVEEESESIQSSSDDEVILTGVSRGSKRKAIESLSAVTAYEEDELEMMGSEEEDEEDEDDVEEISSESEDEDDEEVQFIDAHSRKSSTSKGKCTQSRDITSKDMEKLLKTMKKEYEDLVKQKDEEIERLRNEVKYKDQQMESMNDIMTVNMELEAKINAILGSPDVYKREVAAAAKTKSSADKTVETKTETSVAKEEKESVKGNEAVKGKAETGGSKKEKPTQKPVVTESDSDIEVIEETEAKKPKKKRASSAEEVTENGGVADSARKTRTKRSCRMKPGEGADTEKIEALFVSDDEDDNIKETKPSKNSKGKKDEKISSDEDKKEKKGKKSEDTKESGSEKEEDSPDKGRHNIRKLMTDKKLKDETKAAAKEEKERLERVAKLKEKHQIVSHIDQKTKQPVYTKMVLAFRKDQKTPLVEVNTKVLKKLKPHQVEAVEFLWDSVIETTERLKEGHPGSGCIIAHCMGLGKTLSVISFVHTLLTHKQLKLKTCLVVCPLNTVLNWKSEWQKWLDKKDRLPTYEMASAKNNQSRTALLTKWHKEGGIMIMGYQLFRILAMSNTKSKKRKKIFDDTLIDQGADLIVCDEGHVLKNDSSAISKCMNKIRSKRRIILTGTPLQNNLIEYHCMVSFVKPNLLGTRKEFCNRFVNPITNGQHADSTSYDVKVMKRRAHVLHKMLSGCVQRRDYSALTKFLPPKYEYVLSIRLSPLQIKLYEKYLERQKNSANVVYRGTSLFSDYQALMRIWTHPWVLKMDEIRQEKKMTYCDDDDDELGSFLASDTSEEEEEEEEEEDEETGSMSSQNTSEQETKATEESEEEPPLRRTRRSTAAKDDKKDKHGHANKNNKDKKKNKATKESDSDVEEIFPDGTSKKAKLVAGEVIKHWQTTSRRKGEDEENPEVRRPEEQWWTEHIKEDEHKTKLELSGKLVLLMDILRMAEGLGDKVLVFSQSLLSLDLIEDFLSYKNEEAEKLREGKKGKNANSIPLWKKDEDYCRMDGSTSALNRTKATNFFNCIKNKRMRLFLISTKAGGLGINLDSANRVIIFDASWNPSHDIQSIFRAYRFGQEKDVFIYRFLAQGTMEEKIYERQVTKETLSQRVIDEHQLDRHFTASDLQELYQFQPDRLDDPERKERPTPKVPKDIILAELLSERKEWLVGYHEHDSLLEKRPDEDLSEEERKAAWDDYEKEKQGFMYHYRQPQPAVATYNYRPAAMAHHPAMPGSGAPFPSLLTPSAGLSVPGGGMLPLVAPPVGFSSEQAKLNFQLSQLPRVVQEILKYNPDITPTELQARLRAFMGMHTRYTNVPGFAMLNNPELTGQAEVGGLRTTAGTSGLTTTAALASSVAAAAANPPPPAAATPSPAQLSQAISAGISTAATSAMPSRLPLPGRVPANLR